VQKEELFAARVSVKISRITRLVGAINSSWSVSENVPGDDEAVWSIFVVVLDHEQGAKRPNPE